MWDQDQAQQPQLGLAGSFGLGCMAFKNFCPGLSRPGGSKNQGMHPQLQRFECCDSSSGRCIIGRCCLYHCLGPNEGYIASPPYIWFGFSILFSLSSAFSFLLTVSLLFQLCGFIWPLCIFLYAFISLFVLLFALVALLALVSARLALVCFVSLSCSFCQLNSI